jgi:hypothetical protein
LRLVAAPTRHHEATLPGVNAGLLGQPRLPYARLSGQEHQPPPAAFGRLQSVQDSSQLLLAGYQMRCRQRAEEAAFDHHPATVRGVLRGAAGGSRELGEILTGEPQGVGESADGVVVGRPVDAALEVADRAPPARLFPPTRWVSRWVVVVSDFVLGSPSRQPSTKPPMQPRCLKPHDSNANFRSTAS